MRALIIAALLWVGASAQIEDAIVKIYVAYKKYDYFEPWNVSVNRSVGSGVVIDGQRILTNAHVVANRTFIEVRRYGETKRYEARVEVVSHQSDLALLTIDDPAFFAGITPLEFGELPVMQQKVSLYGYPAGGTQLSITDGVASRVEHFRYVHSGENFLGIQVDAAINPGNSGGPAVSEGKVIGIVMQHLPRAQSIGYLVPTPVIRHFLDDIEDGTYDGFPAIGLVTEDLENPAIREFYGLDANQSGQLITYVTYNEAPGGLQVGDIITGIDGHAIENDGTVNYRGNDFTTFKYYIDLHQMGETVLFDVIRDCQRITIPIPLKHRIDELLLVKIQKYDTMPTYLIYGGYLFSPLTRNLLSQGKNMPMRLRKFTRLWPSEEHQGVVVMVKVLADETNRGNHGLTLWPVETFNGEKVLSFEQFYTMVEEATTPYIVLRDDDGFTVVIDRNASDSHQTALLERYNIAEDRSDDLQ